jgi:RNA polymerase sigma-70 factor (ECF subfamily)
MTTTTQPMTEPWRDLWTPPGGGASGPRAWAASVAIIFQVLSTALFGQSLFRHRTMSATSDPSLRTRRSLLERLKDWDDSASWKDFFETYWRLIFGVACKAGLSESEAEDVVQETILAVAKQMPKFRYDPTVGSFKAWLLQLTRWRITDHLRRKTYQEQGQRKPREQMMDTEFMERQAAPNEVDLDALWEEEWKAQLLEAALVRVRERADSQQFQLFYLHVVKSVPAREVAKKMQVKLAEVYFAKYKLTAAVKREIKRMEKKML